MLFFTVPPSIVDRRKHLRHARRKHRAQPLYPGELRLGTPVKAAKIKSARATIHRYRKPPQREFDMSFILASIATGRAGLHDGKRTR
jgi:hypothetical protein